MFEGNTGFKRSTFAVLDPENYVDLDNMTLVDVERFDALDSVAQMVGDYLELIDALVHAGTRSANGFEYFDAVHNMYFYIIDVLRDAEHILSYRNSCASADQKRQ
ncbi:hypothetical protein QTJ16_001790 [Diplocarpon rosae]|uniref:Uncharacterized protein n=1 Tax=Diplocarpon rosae TaxID=946125 RepID=A0AAD9T4Q1_9HELO|nr:hypothetical protein QTJ16_001790 [Diplocarpon rosae]